ncbi:MAG: hypothetical protein II007_13420 [Gammaproteobacteria bacterium]|nr:hypothetical protein [Gammaproteobacteria bacterium]
MTDDKRAAAKAKKLASLNPSKGGEPRPHDMSAEQLEQLATEVYPGMTDEQLAQEINQLEHSLSSQAKEMAHAVAGGETMTAAYCRITGRQKAGMTNNHNNAENYFRRMGGRKLFGLLREKARRRALQSLDYNADRWMADTARAIGMAMGDLPVTITKLMKAGTDEDGDESAAPVPVELAIKTTDLQAAAAHLRLMGQRLQLLTDKVQHSGRIDGRKVVRLVNRAGKAGQTLLDDMGLASGDDGS